MGGSQSSGTSQSTGYGSSYNQSASLSLPVEMNPTTGNLGSTEAQLQSLYQMINGAPSSNGMLQSFLAPYGGSMVAPITAAQQGTLNNIGSAEGGNFNFDPALAGILTQLQGEASNPVGFAQGVAQGGTGGTSAANAGQILASGLAGPGSPVVGEGQFAADLATGGAIKNVIAQAEQPISQAFQDQTVPGLQGSFAQAGQRGTGSGSSAFDAAFGNAQAQEEAQLGSAASQITNNAYNQGIGSYTNMYGQGASNYENLYGSGLNIAANAPGQYATLSAQGIQDLISTLNAQALPQMTEQLGINNALSTYNSSVSALLQSLGLQIQGEQPAIGYESESASNSASFQNEQSSGQNQSFSFQI